MPNRESKLTPIGDRPVQPSTERARRWQESARSGRSSSKSQLTPAQQQEGIEIDAEPTLSLTAKLFLGVGVLAILALASHYLIGWPK